MMNAAPYFSLVLPTYNEAANLEHMIGAVVPVLEQTAKSFEILIVDDQSPDGTGRVADEITARDNRVRVVHREGPRGLSLAVVAGWLQARGEVLAVMDADLQHPPDLIGRVLSAIDSGADLVVASRYSSGGEIPNWKLHRRLLSLLGTGMVHLALGSKVRGVSDPLSGCFAFRRSALAPAQLRPNAGFKILLEVLSRGTFRTVKEVPYSFALRTSGDSKLTFAVAIRDFSLLTRLIFDRFSGRR